MSLARTLIICEDRHFKIGLIELSRQNKFQLIIWNINKKKTAKKKNQNKILARNNVDIPKQFICLFLVNELLKLRLCTIVSR